MSRSWEIEGFLKEANGRLHVDGVSVVELAKRYGSPLFIFSEKRVRHNIARVSRASEAMTCPLKICYAAKANSIIGVLDVVKNAGCDIEVNSGGELWKAMKAGFAGEQIIFNGTSKEVWEIEDAINAEIYAIQVDSLYELSLIEETARRLGKRASVSLRLVPEIESGTHSGLQTALLTSKFGMMPDEAFSAFHSYKDTPHLDLAGIHLHIGSQNPDAGVYTEALEILFASLLRIHNETGIKLKHINLGGGFPIDYSAGRHDMFLPEVQRRLDEAVARGYYEHRLPDGTTAKGPIPKHMAEQQARRAMLAASYDPADALAEAWMNVEKHAKREGATEMLDEITILTEPGRCIIADAGVCLTTVRNHKERPLLEYDKAAVEEVARRKADKLRLSIKPETSGIGSMRLDPEELKTLLKPSGRNDHWLLTDAGFNILLSMETYKWYYHLISASRADEPHETPYKIAGPLCDGGDVYFDIEGKGRLPGYRILPENVQPGEVLALLNCGAYSLSQASQYNGRFLPAAVMIRENGEAELIRKRDDFDDLARNEIF